MCDADDQGASQCALQDYHKTKIGSQINQQRNQVVLATEQKSGN